MWKCKWFPAAMAAIASLCFGGCASTRPRATAHDSGESADKIAAAHAHYAQGIIEEMNERQDAALKEYAEAARNDPADEALNLEVSRRFIQAKQPEKALEVLTRAASRPNASGPVYARLALVYAQLGKTEQAINANRAAIKRSPELLDGYRNLFLTYIQAKQSTEAWNILEQAFRQRDTSPEFLVGLSELYANFAAQVPAQKKTAQARSLAALNRAASLNPTDPTLRLQLAEGFNAAGDYTKAAQMYLELLKKLPDIPMIRERIHARLTDIYLQNKDHKGASEQLQAIVRDDPTNPQATYWLGSLALEDKKPAEAADWFRKTLVLDPTMEQAYYDLAIAQLNLNQATNALTTLEQARARFSQNFVIEFFTGMTYTQLKDYTNAVRHYTAAEVIAKATEPKRLNERFYFQLGAAAERAGDLVQAEQNFQVCLKLSPDFAEALNYLGYMWAEHDMNLDKARELIEKAVKLEPKNAAFLDSMGWVLFKLKQPKEALDYMLKAVQLLEEPDATVLDHLGDIYAALNQKDKAKEAWEKSLKLEASDTVRKKLAKAEEPK